MASLAEKRVAEPEEDPVDPNGVDSSQADTSRVMPIQASPSQVTPIQATTPSQADSNPADLGQANPSEVDPSEVDPNEVHPSLEDSTLEDSTPVDSNVAEPTLVEANPVEPNAVELNPADAASRAALGKCLIELDRVDDADEHLIEAIRLDAHGEAGETAKEGRTRIAEINFRKRMPGGVRPDAVMYCLGALERFEKMTPQQIQGVGFEIAILGTRGIDPSDSE